MEVFAGLSRGSYLVCIGWTTLVVTNDVGRVGQVFIIAMLTNLICGPFIGTLVDRHNRRHIVMFAHAGIALALFLLGMVWLNRAEPGVGWLFIAVAAASALRMMHHSAHDGLIQAAVAKQDIMSTVARFRGVHLIATAIGTVLAGLVIERISPSMGFVFSAAMSMLLIVPMMLVRGGQLRTTTRGVAAFLSDLRGGVEIFKSSRPIRLLALLAAVSLPVGQLSNAVLSSFVRDDLGRGSAAFGMVDAAWPLGGMCAALLLSLGLQRLSGRNMEYFFALLAGLSTVGLSLCSTIPMLVLLHGAMGMSVWLCRIVIDGRVLEKCSQENVGRTKVGFEMAFSLSALIMCLSPTIVRLPNAGLYFLFWGILVTVVTATVWCIDKNRRIE